MELRETSLPGCYELIPPVFKDNRGSFVKTFHAGLFREKGLHTDWQEEYYSVSGKGVLRGMHFQLPPHDHDKIVYCPVGEVLDVVLDLRRGSPSFGRHAAISLNSERANMLYIPKGCAHGFYTVSDHAMMMYKVSTVYAPESDTGILWSSAGIPWPCTVPVVSARDAGFATLDQFASPFIFHER
jgi:dTDP-4-dehydrorhamnose 3,5-epimerase